MVHLEDREGLPLNTERLPWWTAALGKGARKHRHGHGHGHIKTQHHKHQDEVRTVAVPSAVFRPAHPTSSRYRPMLPVASKVGERSLCCAEIAPLLFQPAGSLRRWLCCWAVTGSRGGLCLAVFFQQDVAHFTSTRCAASHSVPEE